MGNDYSEKPPPDIEIGGLSVGPFSLSVFKVRGLGRLGDLLFPERTARLEMARALTARVQDGGLAENEPELLKENVGLHLERMRNSNRVAQKAVEIFPEVEKQFKALPPYTSGPTTTSKEWKNKFRRQAEDIEDEDLMTLYAKIACGEAARPGSFSVRTIEVLSALTRDELHSFEQACSRVFHGTYLLDGHHGLSDQDQMGLHDARLLAFGDSAMHITPDANETETIGYGARQLVMKLDQVQSFDIRVVVLTNAGRELARIPVIESNEEYFRALARTFSEHATVLGWRDTERGTETLPFDPPL